MENENILVTGGAGYIGSHTVRKLLQENYNVTILDNLSKGHAQTIPKGVNFYEIDLGDKEKLNDIFKENKIDSVIHFAGSIEAGESMINPQFFRRNNVVNSINLLDAMLKSDVKKIVFSSSAAVYETSKDPLTEDSPKVPTSVYGKTKLFVESALENFDCSYGLKSISLRYFNAAGAGFDIGEDHNPETHLIPLTLQVPLGKRESIEIFGTDYPTKDGTCIRDYVHVLDLADAHVLALQNLNETSKSRQYNLGIEKGYSVLEVIEAAKKVTGCDISVIESEKRAGDPAILIADASKAKKELGWSPKFSLEDIVASAWNWHRKNPDGFE